MDADVVKYKKRLKASLEALGVVGGLVVVFVLFVLGSTVLGFM